MKNQSRRSISQSLIPHDWRTTDADEIERRRVRAERDPPRITNLDPHHPILSNFRVTSASGMTYSVELRSLAEDQYSCSCVDFRINGLGTCKHVEATLQYLRGRYPRLFSRVLENGFRRIDILPDSVSGRLRATGPLERLPRRLGALFSPDGTLPAEDVEGAVQTLHSAGIRDLRISQEVAPWLEERQRDEEARRLRHEYEQRVQSGKWPMHETLVPLYPYQRIGMLHLAFTERALLADEMGLGKTIQAIAACALLHRIGKVRRVLVVTPASLKTEWEEQIQRFTPLPYRLVFGPRHKRLRLYDHPEFFTIVNYEQMLIDALDVNRRLQPDAIILDEAQRIKNWTTKTAQAVKRLKSRYAFVLTGTPIENRIDELHSLMAFLNPTVLGPLFRFNRDFYELDDRGRPSGYRNLNELHNRIRPYMIRRRKADVEAELPSRSDKTFFVPLSSEQANRYAEHEANVARILSAAKRRPLTQQEQEKLMRELAMMRMVCDTNYILEPEDRACPKLGELKKILEECRENSGSKVLIFSEWERMLALVRELCERLGLRYALHTGSVPQLRRRAEIRLFKNDPECRVFLSTDSGSTGLNLQDASVVINCDLPWNPARLEQRIARAWRKHQTKPVTVIHLVSENTIEHRMLSTLAGKQALADGVLDLRGDLTSIKLIGGRQAFLSRLQQLMSPAPPGILGKPEKQPRLPADRALAFSRAASEKLRDNLVRCEETYPLEGAHSVLVAVVERDAGVCREQLAGIYDQFFGKSTSDPLAPVKLEVIDRASDEAVKRLIQAGLISPAVRATRPLHPEGGSASAPLSEEQRKRTADLRSQSRRKVKLARLLLGEGFMKEAREAAIEVVLQLAGALAVENGLAEPAGFEDVLHPAFTHCWQDSLPAIRSFTSSPEEEPLLVLKAIEPLLGDGG